MKKTMLKTTVAALAAATVSSVLADRTYDQPGTTTFTSAETETGYVKVASSTSAFDSDWQVWTTDGTEGAGLTLPNSSLRIAESNGQTGRLKIDSGLYIVNQASQVNGNYKWSPFIIGNWGGTGYYWQTGGSVTITDNDLVIGGSGDTNQRGVGSFLLEGGSFVNTSSGTVIGYGYGSGTFEMRGGTFESKGNFQIVEGPGSDSSATISGGELTVSGVLDVGNGSASGGVGTFTASGDAKVSASSIKVGTNVKAGTFTLSDNASVETKYFVTGTGTINFDGGALRAQESNSSFIPSSDNITVNVKSGGAVIDTQGYAITVNEPLLSGVEEGETDGGLVKVGRGQLTLASGNTYNGLTDVREGVLAVSAGHEFAGDVRIGSHGAIAVDMTSVVDTGSIAVDDTFVVFKTPSSPEFEYANDTLEESVFLSGPVFGYTLSYDSAQGAVVATVTDVTNISSTRKITAFGAYEGYIDNNDAQWTNGQPVNGSYDVVVFCGDATMSVYSKTWGEGANRACETMAIRGATVLAQHPNDWNPCLDKNKIVGHGTLRLRRLGVERRSAPGVGVTVGENVTLDVVQTSANSDTWFTGSVDSPVIVNGDTYVTNGLMRVNDYVTFNGDIYVGGTGSLYNGGLESATTGTSVNGNIVLIDGAVYEYSRISSPVSGSGTVIVDGGALLVSPDSVFTYRSGTIRIDGSTISNPAVGIEVVLANATIESGTVNVEVVHSDYSWTATLENDVVKVTATGIIDPSTPNYWIGGASGEWKVAGNWSRGVPSAAYTTEINTDATITLDGDKTAGVIVVNGTVHFKNSAGNPSIFFNAMSGTGRIRLSHIGLIADAAETEIASTLTLEPVITTTDSWLEGRSKLLVVRAPLVGSGYVIVRNNVRFYGDNSGFEGQFRKDDADMRFMTPESGLPNAWKTDIDGTLWLMFSNGTIQFAGNSTFNAKGNHGIHLPAEPGNVVLEVGVGGGDVTFTKTGDGYRFYTENGGNWSAESAGCATATLRKVGAGTFTNNAYDTYNLDCAGGTTVLSNDSETVAVTVRDGATLKVAEDHTVGSVAFESGAKFVTTVSETTEDEVTVSSAACLTASGAIAFSDTVISTDGATPDPEVRYNVISAASLSGSVATDIEDPDTTDRFVWLAKKLGSGVSLKYGRANPGFAVVIR